MGKLQVDYAEDLGLQFTENPHRMVGQDGAYSIPLGDRAFWFFGDTLVGERVPGESLWFPGGVRLGPGDMSGHGSIEKLYNNTGLILRDRSGNGGLKDFEYITDEKNRLRQLIPHVDDETPDEIRVWCMHGIAVNENLYLYYLTVRMLAEGPMPVNFELVGAGVARGRIGEWKFERLRYEGRTLWWDATLPLFGSAVLQGKDGYIYLYGIRKDSMGIQRCYLARVREPEIEQLDSYEYLVSEGPEWSSQPDNLRDIMTDIPNEMSVEWNPYLGCYLAVHSLDLSGKIVGRTAPEPWGPWSDTVELWQVKPPQLDYEMLYDPLIYAAKSHPELSDNQGQVLYITYIEFEEYFPHLIKIALA